MACLREIVKFCNKRILVDTIKDFPGAFNGLQVENNGSVSKIGASVDAGLIPFKNSINESIDFLIVHHGLFGLLPLLLLKVLCKGATMLKQ